MGILKQLLPQLFLAKRKANRLTEEAEEGMRMGNYRKVMKAAKEKIWIKLTWRY